MPTVKGRLCALPHKCDGRYLIRPWRKLVDCNNPLL